ncbi:MAG TPA: hypothetical protein VFC93_04790 [Chloroflexota bacterium]|jgi:hypothetical protein|nr:hypothetical protein [Chloroflexota bacterium]
MACNWLRWPSARLQTWDPAEQAAALATIENELPPVLAGELRLWGWFDLPWPEEAAILRVHADRWPSVDVHEALLADGRLVVGRYVESWRLPGELDGYTPAGLAHWVWQLWELDGVAALRAAASRVRLGAEPNATAAA